MNRITMTLLAISAAAVTGCQTGVAPTEMLESQTPPAVQSAWLEHHKGMVIEKVTSTPMNGQPTYRFEYKDAQDHTHVTVYNVGGDEIESTN